MKYLVVILRAADVTDIIHVYVTSQQAREVYFDPVAG